MSLRLFNEDDNQGKEVKTEESVYCIIYLSNMTTSFFVRASVTDELKSLIASDSEDIFSVDYLQRIYDPIEEKEALTSGEFSFQPKNISAVSFERGPDFPLFYL